MSSDAQRGASRAPPEGAWQTAALTRAEIDAWRALASTPERARWRSLGAPGPLGPGDLGAHRAGRWIAWCQLELGIEREARVRWRAHRAPDLSPHLHRALLRWPAARLGRSVLLEPLAVHPPDPYPLAAYLQQVEEGGIEDRQLSWRLYDGAWIERRDEGVVAIWELT